MRFRAGIVFFLLPLAACAAYTESGDATTGGRHKVNDKYAAFAVSAPDLGLIQKNPSGALIESSAATSDSDTKITLKFEPGKNPKTKKDDSRYNFISFTLEQAADADGEKLFEKTHKIMNTSFNTGSNGVMRADVLHYYDIWWLGEKAYFSATEYNQDNPGLKASDAPKTTHRDTLTLVLAGKAAGLQYSDFGYWSAAYAYLDSDAFVLDKNGNKVPVLGEDGKPVYNDNGDQVFRQGNYVYLNADDLQPIFGGIEANKVADADKWNVAGTFEGKAVARGFSFEQQLDGDGNVIAENYKTTKADLYGKSTLKLDGGESTLKIDFDRWYSFEFPIGANPDTGVKVTGVNTAQNAVAFADGKDATPLIFTTGPDEAPLDARVDWALYKSSSSSTGRIAEAVGGFTYSQGVANNFRGITGGFGGKCTTAFSVGGCK